MQNQFIAAIVSAVVKFLKFYLVDMMTKKQASEKNEQLLTEVHNAKTKEDFKKASSDINDHLN